MTLPFFKDQNKPQSGAAVQVSDGVFKVHNQLTLKEITLGHLDGPERISWWQAQEQQQKKTISHTPPSVMPKNSDLPFRVVYSMEFGLACSALTT